ncbi:MAG: MoaD/ThiS family protein [Armatimonadetes bacterium]|nr:MoaD/ThiS family protein [Armatimonadota bacterium]
MVHLDAGSVGEALAQLVARYPALRSRLCEQGGRLRPSVLFFVNSEDIRTRSGEQTLLSEGDELAIVMLAEGG